MQDLMAISIRKVAHIENHEILDTIGEGQFAKVKLAQHVLTKEVVAIKVIQKTNQSSSGLKAIRNVIVGCQPRPKGI